MAISEKESGATMQSFEDFLPLRATYYAPGEYRIVDAHGHRLWYMEGRSLAEAVVLACNTYSDLLAAALQVHGDCYRHKCFVNDIHNCVLCTAIAKAQGAVFCHLCSKPVDPNDESGVHDACAIEENARADAESYTGMS